MTKTPFKMKGFSGFGTELHVTTGVPISPWNPQYEPGHQRGGGDSKEAPKKENEKIMLYKKAKL